MSKERYLQSACSKVHFYFSFFNLPAYYVTAYNVQTQNSLLKAGDSYSDVNIFLIRVRKLSIPGETFPLCLNHVQCIFR